MTQDPADAGTPLSTPVPHSGRTGASGPGTFERSALGRRTVGAAASSVTLAAAVAQGAAFAAKPHTDLDAGQPVADPPRRAADSTLPQVSEGEAGALHAS
ncbi:hypothetical protein [Streptomyces sp. NPDC052225]|uniref:hypothetical protein n=1 Tax=Streptomyces sp. NPDC052225 TaxID=3154949 RepID=UPI00341E5BDF